MIFAEIFDAGRMKRKGPPSNQNPSQPSKKKCEISYVRRHFSNSHPFSRAEQIYRPNKRKFPARVDAFKRIAHIGEGTYGLVFQAKIKGGTGREHVALKRIVMCQEPVEVPESFIREIQILHTLNHPNVVALLDIVTNEQVSLVGEYERDHQKWFDQDILYNQCVQLVAKKLGSEYPQIKGLNPKSKDFVAQVRQAIPLEAGDHDLHGDADGDFNDNKTARQKYDEEVRNELNKRIDKELKKRRANNPACFFLVFEFVDHDLSGILNAPNLYLRQEEIKHIFLEIMTGLEYLHSVGIMHRDVKCANVLISKSGHVKLCDFNLSVFMDQSKHPNEYTNRAVTLWYRPPEIILGSTTYDETVDIWSAGVVLLEMLLRKAPFQGRTPLQQWKTICEKCGSPSQRNFPDAAKLPWYDKYMEHIPRPYQRQFVDFYRPLIKNDTVVYFADRLLQMDPKCRPSAKEVLNDPWFKQEPLPRLKQFNFHSCHELRFRKRSTDKPKPQKYGASRQKQQVESDSDDSDSGSYDPTPPASPGIPEAPSLF